LVIGPEEYNQRYKEIKNLNKLLAHSHAKVIEELYKKSGADKIILDKFGKAELVEAELDRREIGIELVQSEQGERFAPVAAASILARAAFIRALEELSESIQMEMPKGASELVDEAGRRIVKKFGDKALIKLAKVHFKNFNRVVSPSLFSK
jgi:ribonuclease HIII